MDVVGIERRESREAAAMDALQYCGATVLAGTVYMRERQRTGG
jgi:hypothetical protein